MGISTILLLVAVICFVLDAIPVSIPRVRLLAIGLAAFAGSFLVGAGRL